MRREERTHGARPARVTRLGGDLTVGDHVPDAEGIQHPSNGDLERGEVSASRHGNSERTVLSGNPDTTWANYLADGDDSRLPTNRMDPEPTADALDHDRPADSWWPLELLGFRRLSPRRLTEACRRLRQRHSSDVQRYGWQTGGPRSARRDGDP
jgi:hypothetical protein